MKGFVDNPNRYNTYALHDQYKRTLSLSLSLRRQTTLTDSEGRGVAVGVDGATRLDGAQRSAVDHHADGLIPCYKTEG